MNRLYAGGVALCFISFFVIAGFSQGYYPQGISPELIMEQQEKRIARLKKENPVFAESEERVFVINKRIQEIIEEFQTAGPSRKEIALAKRRARRKLKPLVQELIEITTDPEYMAEQRMERLLVTPRRR